MTCPGGFSCASLEGFVASMWPFAIALAVAGGVLLVRMFTGGNKKESCTD